ncbi:hypothetical protein ACK3ZR_20430 [Aeromonas caviae]
MWRPLLTLSALVVSAPLLAIEVPQAPHLVVSGYAEQKAEPDMLTLNVGRCFPNQPSSHNCPSPK